MVAFIAKKLPLQVAHAGALTLWQVLHFSFEMDVKSVITKPSGGQRLTGPGMQEIVGQAWSGRGKVVRVDVSCDSGATWRQASLDTPVLSKAITRFSLPWEWRGQDAWILSRATDDTGDVQPSRAVLVKARGLNSGPDGFNHYNEIKAWHVKPDGEVSHF